LSAVYSFLCAAFTNACDLMCFPWLYLWEVLHLCHLGVRHEGYNHLCYLSSFLIFRAKDTLKAQGCALSQSHRRKLIDFEFQHNSSSRKPRLEKMSCKFYLVRLHLMKNDALTNEKQNPDESKRLTSENRNKKIQTRSTQYTPAFRH